MPDSVDAATVRRWCATGLDALRRHQDEIDRLNVYPVPDGDTGTNLVLTLGAAVDALAAVGSAPLGAVLRVAARGALLGARGNSGIILAQLLKGLAESLAGVESADGRLLALALDHAAKTAYKAVAAPVEGTVLSVGTAAGKAALAAAGLGDGAAAAARDGDGARAAAGDPGGARGATGAGARGTDGAGVAAARGADSAGAAVGDGDGAGAGARGADGAGAAAGDGDGEGANVGGVAGGLVGVARAAAEAARAALARTPEQLPALARAGVVDAGGRGLVVLLDALVEAVSGVPMPRQREEPRLPEPPVVIRGGAGRPPVEMEREAGSAEFGYEVQYLLEAPAGAVDGLRGRLNELGDSVMIVGDETTWHVHVHVNDVGAAIEVGIQAGRPSRITVTRFADQVVTQRPAEPVAAVVSQAGGAATDRGEHRGTVERGGRAASGPEQRPEAAAQRQERSVVAVCSGPGLGELLAAEGAAVLTGTPSTGEILAAIKATGAGRVVVLPNDPNVLAVAGVAAAEARAAGIRTGVVPTRSPVQALAAMAVRDQQRRFEDDVIAMAEAAARCRSAEVTIASREALTVAGRCQPGDILAIVDGEVNLIGQDLSRTACELLDRMLTGGGELVTLIAGQGAPADLGEALQAHVAGAWPFVEVQCYKGGQPHYPLLIGVE